MASKKKSNPFRDREKDWQRKPKKQKIKLDLTFRDEICRSCGKKFRAGFAAEGYAEILFIGYHHAGMKRRQLVCPRCVGTLLKVIGEAPVDILMIAPSKIYSWDDTKDGFPKRASNMKIDGKIVKYNRKKLEAAVKKFSKKMKKLEPYSNIDYYKLSGLKR